MKGYDSEWDKQHTWEDLVQAGVAYAEDSAKWGLDKIKDNLVAYTTRKRLVVAAALLGAAIDRMDRA